MPSKDNQHIQHIVMYYRELADFVRQLGGRAGGVLCQYYGAAGSRYGPRTDRRALQPAVG